MKTIATISDDALAKLILKKIINADELIISQMLGIHPMFAQTNAHDIEMYVPRLEHYDKNEFVNNDCVTSKHQESIRIENTLIEHGHKVPRQFYPFQLNQSIKLNKYRQVEAVIAQSNHDKSYAFRHNQRCRMISTSSNLELKNPTKIETATICDVSQDIIDMQRLRNQWMYEQGQRFWEQSEKWNYESIDITGRLWDALWVENTLMGGPGIHGGPKCLVEKIIEIIESANEFIQIHTQHFTGGFDGYEELFSAAQKARARGVTIWLTTQSDGSNYASETAKHKSSQLLSDWTNIGCEYVVNRHTHCKCVLSDSGGITMTANISSMPLTDKIVTLNNVHTTDINSVHVAKIHIAEAFTAMLLPPSEAMSLSHQLLTMRKTLYPSLVIQLSGQQAGGSCLLGI